MVVFAYLAHVNKEEGEEIKSKLYVVIYSMCGFGGLEHDLKGITTRGGKSTFQIGETPEDNNTNNISSGSAPSEQEQPNETNPELEIRKEPSVEPKRSTLPFPHRVRKEKDDAYQRKFLENLKQLQLSIPFMEALVQMPKFAKYLKSLLTNKSKLEEACTMTMGKRSSAALLNKLPSKEKDPGSFTIPCQIKNLYIGNALADLGASISLMPSANVSYNWYQEPRFHLRALDSRFLVGFCGCSWLE
ncbi:hypothetical protein CTI12_AA048410 [Artemisia annua]|uniref:Reverse transcriptase domain-containing protein n=1 Tax=Artemisia annua TaxID=35608 RepID=A0A2U1QCU8_ARTAN|nr:hypothetical protein CTI12_AA048410 [Artemisia annua]